MMSLSSGSEGVDARYLGMDEKKRKRMLSNRESARRSRMRKQKHLEDLTKEIGTLERKKGEILKACDARAQGLIDIKSENEALRAEKSVLESYLENMNSVVSNLRQNGPSCPRFGSECQEPWQVRSPSRQIMATSSTFRI